VDHLKIEALDTLALGMQKDGVSKFTSSSGDNSSLASAFSARHFNIPILVVLPETTPNMIIDKIKDQEALVIQHRIDWQEADNYARTLSKKHNDCYISPFDHPLI